MAAMMDTRKGTRLGRAGMATPLLALACACLGGCASGPLTMDFIVVGETRTLTYHLDPDGRLTVSGGGGTFEARPAQTVYQDRLDEQAMNRLKQVVAGSGFFLAGPAFGGALTSGPALRAEIRLGMWHNRIDTRGAQVKSVTKIAAELNRHLPEGYALPTTTGPAKREENEVQRYLKEMGEP